MGRHNAGKPVARISRGGRSRRPERPARTPLTVETRDDGGWIPQRWLDTLARCEHEYEIEHEHVAHLQAVLLASDTLRSLVQSAEPGPHRAWLCFLPLVDVLLDPEGNGLPLAGMHP